MSDPFERFASECGLHLAAERLGIAPRDVLAPLPQVEQHFIVTLSGPETGTPHFRLIYATPLSAKAPPSMRDVLWWAASDAWMLEEGSREIRSWAASYGYPPDDGATACLFAQQIEQADALLHLLGEVRYHQLLELYDRESSPTRMESPV